MPSVRRVHDLQKVGRTIRRLRVDAEMSATELSRRTGVARSTLHYIEKKQQIPDLGTLAQLAAALGYVCYISFRKKNEEIAEPVVAQKVNHE